MTEASIIRSVVAFGCFCGAYGLSVRWWVGVMAGTLAWVYPHHGTIAIAVSLAIYALWAVFSRRSTKCASRRNDIIDVEFEVIDE
jgi:hypothetical protein